MPPQTVKGLFGAQITDWEAIRNTILEMPYRAVQYWYCASPVPAPENAWRFFRHPGRGKVSDPVIVLYSECLRRHLR